MTTEESVTTQQLFGAVRYLPLIGSLPPPLAQLRSPLPQADARAGEYGLYLFCSGCGAVQPVLKSAIAELAGETKDSYNGFYLQAERCDVDGSDELVGLRLLPVPMDS